MLNTGVLNGGCWLIEGFGTSSLHYVIFLSFCSFSYSGVCSDLLELSLCDLIVFPKSSSACLLSQTPIQPHLKGTKLNYMILLLTVKLYPPNRILIKVMTKTFFKYSIIATWLFRKTHHLKCDNFFLRLLSIQMWKILTCGNVLSFVRFEFLKSWN